MSVTLTPRLERWLVTALLGVFLLLGLGFSLGPVFETWDEPGHYRYIYALVHDGRLPSPFDKPIGEYHQAPLYYLLMMPSAALVGMPDILPYEARQNPFYGYAWQVASADNKNLFIHPREEQFPYADYPAARSIHLLRLTSLALNAATLLVAYRVFHLLWPDHPARRLAALGIAAFTPVFTALSGAISNDNLALFLSVTGLYLLLIKRAHGFRWGWAVLLGVVLGAGAITKTNLIFMFVPAAYVLISDRACWRAIPVIGAIVLGVAGWYYARNALLYGDLTGMKTLEALFPLWLTPRDQITWVLVLSRLVYLYQTYWARFGFNAIGVDWPIQAVYDAISLITALTLPLLAWRAWKSQRGGDLASDQRRHIIILGLYGLSLIGLAVYGAAQTVNLVQGRYVLPGIAAWAAAIVLAIETWLPARLRQIALLGLPPLLAVLAAICLFGYYLPAFELKPVPRTIGHPLGWRYGDVAELIGADAYSVSVGRGHVARITLYWRALGPAASNLHVRLKTAGAAVVDRESLPGAGKLYASEWQPGQTWGETWVLLIPADAAPGAYALEVTLAAPESGPSLPAADSSGMRIDPAVVTLNITP